MSFASVPERTNVSSWSLTVVVIVMTLLASPTAFAQTEIDMVWWVSDADVEGKRNEVAIIELFEEAHPDIKVNLIYVDWNMFPDQTLAWAAVGDLPDVLWIREDSLYDLATRGLLMDLGPYIARDPDFDPNNFLPGVLESARVNGVQVALHRDVWAPTVFFNRTWFQEYGLADPESGWTYVDLLDTARKLTDPTKFKFGMGNIDSNRNAVILSYGGSLMNTDQTEFTLTDLAVIEATTYMRSYRWEYHAEAQPGELADWWEPQWVRGDVAMQFWGPWAWPNYKETVTFDWDVAPPMAGPAGTYTFLDGLLLGVSSQTKNAEAAWKLVRFLGYDSRAQTEQVRRGMASPTVRYPETLAAFYESENAPGSIQNYIAVLQSGRAGIPRLPREVSEIVNQAFTSIMNDEQSVTSALGDAQVRATVALRDVRNR